MHVTNQIPVAAELMHFTIYDNSLETHIAGLCSISNGTTNMISSDQFVHIKIVGSKCSSNRTTLSKTYTSIEYLNDKLIAVPFKTTEFEIITTAGGERFQTTSTISTPHLLKYFQIQVYPTFFVTFGIDGLVIVWDCESLRTITTFISHNKRFGGVRKCVADTSRRLERCVVRGFQSNRLIESNFADFSLLWVAATI